jgi:hypothetical protein
MQLPPLAPDYTWRVATCLTDEHLARNEARIEIVRTNPRRLVWWRSRTIAQKSVTFKSAQKREEKLERAAKKLWKRQQALAFEENQVSFANYNAAENLRREHAHLG